MKALSTGHVLRIPDFDFENGAETRDKYLIVIDTNEEKALFLRVLTTSKVKVPEDKIMHGCRNEPNNGLHYFMFEKDRCIGSLEKQDFSFLLHTFILFRNNIKEVDTFSFIQKYEHTAELVCEMQEDEFLRLKKCIRQNGRMADRSAKRNFPDIFNVA
ncbi:hypothetical protein [Pedobacter sp. SL55]|uniref:hypothetical protein n=1 Tax=Pedobacter sp. SL55 TaxID=2995161 RepID=UPI0022714FB3|nr:hypothetical protein [Pedobacter sp. SL55]WAC39871.1 hypothetical protein OVA16_14965 [Pedobacter sp. SL55]